LVKLSKYEQETIINYNQEEDYAYCYTFDPKLIRKLDNLCSKSSTITVEKEGNGCKEYKFPKKWVKVNFPRVVSEKMKQDLAERARKNFGHTDGDLDG
jgi:thiamine monophosphate kinase